MLFSHTSMGSPRRRVVLAVLVVFMGASLGFGDMVRLPLNRPMTAAPNHPKGFTQLRARSLIVAESFETPGTNDHYTVVGEHDDGNRDFFFRGILPDDYAARNRSCMLTGCSGQDGSYVYAGRDTDSDGPGECSVTLSPADVRAFTNLQVVVAVAAPTARSLPGSGGLRYSRDDYIHVETRFDGGPWQKVGAFHGETTSASSAFRVDTDFDGIGDGDIITNRFTDYTYTPLGAGTSLQARVLFCMRSSDAEATFDYLRITGHAVSPVSEGMSVVVQEHRGDVGPTAAPSQRSGPVPGGLPVTVEVPLARSVAVAYSPSGGQVAVGGSDGSHVEVESNRDGLVALIDAVTGKQQFLLRHTANRIHAVAYSPDGHTLAVATDRGLRLWNPAEGTEWDTRPGGGDDPIRRVATDVVFSPDGKLLAVARSPIELWDVESSTLLHKMESWGDTHLAFSPDGSLLASASYRNEVDLWRVADGQKLASVHAQMGPLNDVAFDRQGERVAAVGGGAKRWRIKKDEAGKWSLADEERLAGPGGRGVSFSPDGRLLATYGDDGVVVIYDSPTLQVAGTLLRGGPFAFSPDGISLAASDLLLGRKRSPSGMVGARLSLWRIAELLDADRMAEQARIAATDLVRALASPAPELGPDLEMVQGMPAVLLGPQGEAAAPVLIEALTNPLVKEKQSLIYPLAIIAGRDATVRAALIETLRTSESVDVRMMVMMMLGTFPVEMATEAVPALVEAAVNDESPDLRAAAGETLRRIAPEAYEQVAGRVQARGPIEDRVERRDGKLSYRGRSIEEWIKRLSVSFIPNEIFGRPRPDEPLAAIRAIGPEAVPVLVRTLKSSEWPMQRAAVAGLEALGPQAVPAVGPLLEVISSTRDEDFHMVAEPAADLVTLIVKDQNELPGRLVALTNSDRPAVRLIAARVVAVLAPAHPRGLPVLRAAHAAVTLEDEVRAMSIRRFPEKSNVGWLGRMIADDKAPAEYRVEAVRGLARMGEAALPVISEMLSAAVAADPIVSRQAVRAIRKLGPKAVPAVRDALQSTTDNREQSILKERLRGGGSESLWWAAVCEDWKSLLKLRSLTAEALKRAGQEVQPCPPQSSTPSARSLSGVSTANVAWLLNLLADKETPREIEHQVASDVFSAPWEELVPVLPMLLNESLYVQHPWMFGNFMTEIGHKGPQVIPVVKDAIETVQSDYFRRMLLFTLVNVGEEGRKELSRLIEINPQYRPLLAPNPTPSSRLRNK